MKFCFTYVWYRSCVLSETTHIQCGKPAGSLEVSGSIQSDEEYLSPQEEAMDIGDLPAPTKSVRFKEPPFFQVGESQNNSVFIKNLILSELTNQQKRKCVDVTTA